VVVKGGLTPAQARHWLFKPVPGPTRCGMAVLKCAGLKGPSLCGAENEACQGFALSARCFSAGLSIREEGHAPPSRRGCVIEEWGGGDTFLATYND